MSHTKKSKQTERTKKRVQRASLRFGDVWPVLVSFVLATVIMAPALAGAMTVNTTTARSQQTSSGNAIFGGEPTRVTWEGTVGEDEEVAALSINYPEGSAITSESYAKLTILDGIERLETDGVAAFDGLTLNITFTTPLAAGTLLRVEMYEVSLPNINGEVVLTGTYTNTAHITAALNDSPAITVQHITVTDKIVSWLDEQGWVEAWNSVPILRTFFKPQLIVATIPSLFVGWLRAFGLVLIGFPLAIPIGLCLALIKMGRVQPFKALASLYINIVRGTPLFLQIYIAFFGLPLLGFNFNNYALGVVVLAMNSSAYLAEIFRAGIQSIHKGQFEASASLGMNKAQTMFFVIIPQTVRRVIPTMTSEFILLYKDTSLLSAVGVMELMMFSKSLVANNGNITPYIIAACYYLLVTLPLIKVVGLFERKLGAGDGSQGGLSDEETGKKKKRGKNKPLKWTPDAEASIEVTSAAHSSK